MSVHAISLVLKHSKARLGDRLVLIVLADHADREGANSYPAVPTIAEEALLSERAVQYALRSLERAGEIVRIGTSRWGTAVWKITLPETARGADIAGGADSAGVQSTTDSVPDSAPKPSFEPTTTSGGMEGGLGTPPSPPVDDPDGLKRIGSVIPEALRRVA